MDKQLGQFLPPRWSFPLSAFLELLIFVCLGTETWRRVHSLYTRLNIPLSSGPYPTIPLFHTRGEHRRETDHVHENARASKPATTAGISTGDEPEIVVCSGTHGSQLCHKPEQEEGRAVVQRGRSGHVVDAQEVSQEFAPLVVCEVRQAAQELCQHHVRRILHTVQKLPSRDRGQHEWANESNLLIDSAPSRPLLPYGFMSGSEGDIPPKALARRLFWP